MKAFIVVTGLGVWTACSVSAQTQAKPQETTQPSPPATAPAPVNAGGSVVFVDPVTRKIRRPGPSEIGAQTSQSRAAVVARPATPPVLIHGPGGAVGIQLDDSDMSYMVATRKADGKIALECVTGPAADPAAPSPQPAST